MAIKNTIQCYGSAAKFFHWLIAILVVFMLLLGAFLGDFPKQIKPVMFIIHKSTGLTIMALMILRLLWALLNTSPMLSATTPKWQRIISRGIHGLFYLCLIAMPLSGFLMSSASGHATNVWWLFSVKAPIPENKALASFLGDVHTYLAWAILVLITLHILAAIKHFFIDKDHTVQRMLPFQKT